MSALSAAQVSKLLGSYKDRAATTRRAYMCSLKHFADWCEKSVVDAVLDVLSGSSARAQNKLVSYRLSMLASLSTNTVNAKLSAIKSVLARARLAGMIDWACDVSGVRVELVRDMRGPKPDDVAKMLRAENTERDVALIRLAYDLALRREEISRLDLADFDASGRLNVRGKGKRSKEWMNMPESTAAAVSAWVAVRGRYRGPLFVAVDRGHYGHRLTATSIYRVIVKIGDAVGVAVRPNGLRHTAITTALTLSGGNGRSVKTFSRHALTDSVEDYDDRSLARTRPRKSFSERISADMNSRVTGVA